MNLWLLIVYALLMLSLLLVLTAAVVVIALKTPSEIDSLEESNDLFASMARHPAGSQRDTVKRGAVWERSLRR